MQSSLLETLKILGLLPFSGVTPIVLFTKSTSVHFRFQASPALMPVSFSNCRKAEVLGPHPFMRVSSSCSVGMNGNFSTPSGQAFSVSSMKIDENC